MMKLNLSVQSHSDHALIQVGGEVDLATCPQLQAVLAELVDRGFHQLILDLEQVSFLDCAGIGVLVEARRRVHKHRGSLKLVRPRPLVRRVLEVTGMTAVFPIDSSLWGGAGYRAGGTVKDAIVTRLILPSSYPEVARRGRVIPGRSVT